MAAIKGYRRVQNDLRKQIILGTYAVGDMLPSENKLSAQYGLSRMTVRHALKNLEHEGLVYRRQGKGNFAGEKKNSLDLLSVKGFTEVMKGRGEVSTAFIQEPKEENWKEDFFWDLEENEKKQGCISFSRIRKVDGRATMFEESFIVNKDMKDFCEKPFVNGSLFDTLLVNYDVEIKNVAQKIRAISASEIIASKLEMEVGMPVLEILRKLSTNVPGLYIFSSIYCDTKDFMIEL